MAFRSPITVDAGLRAGSRAFPHYRITLRSMDPLATIVERLCAWKDVNREQKDSKDSFFVRGQVFAYLGK